MFSEKVTLETDTDLVKLIGFCSLVPFVKDSPGFEREKFEMQKHDLGFFTGHYALN